MKSRAPESYRVTHTLTITDYVLEHEGEVENGDDYLYANVDWADVYAECIDSIMSTIEFEVSNGESGGEVDLYLDEENIDVGLPDCVLRVEWSVDFDSIAEW